MDTSLLEYIEQEIIPRYSSFDKAHREDHARTVIARAMEMGRNYDIDEDMLLAAAAFHDLGLAVDRKTHHLESGRIIREDARLREWFSPDQIETIAQAAEDHRASAKTAPRSIYGRLVAEADRLIVPETIIRRTIQYGMSHYPELDKEGHWQRTLAHLHEKYARGGYLHLLIPGSPNEEPLERLRDMIEDEGLLRQVFDRMFEGTAATQAILSRISDNVIAMARATGAVKAYAKGGLVDYTGLAAVHGSPGNPEMVLSAADTEKFLQAAQMMQVMNGIAPSMTRDIRALIGGGGGNGMNIGGITLDISIDHVQDYNDFVTQLQADPKFEKLIDTMTMGRMLGGSKLAKNGIRF